MKRLLFLSTITLFLISCKIEKEKEAKVVTSEKENVVLVVDVSLSMLGKDFTPNRILSVEKMLKDIIQSKKDNQHFSIIVYSGDSYMICHLTTDKTELLSAASQMDKMTMQMRPGTNYSEAILNAIRVLKDDNGKGSIFIVSDGINTINTYPLKWAESELLKNKISINSLVINPKEFAILPTRMDMRGKLQFEKLPAPPLDSNLIKLSEKTFGVSTVVHNNADLEKFNFEQLLKASNFKKKQGIFTSPKQPLNEKKAEKIYTAIAVHNDSLKTKLRF